MSENKHTPGPWSVVDGHYPGFITITGPSSSISIVTSAIDLDFNDYLVRTADAHLIASAPELLSIVQRFVALDAQWHPDRHAAEKAELMAEARATIAKARGES